MESKGDTSMPASPDAQWAPYQRPGKLGEDYDEYGSEMAPKARVWKRYVEETDKTDKELVEGWNKTLDVLLLFAALFSAISTAFVLESSQDLKPDYTENSAQTLLIMSQTLSAIARGSPVNDSTASDLEAPPFTPSTSAIIVNTLWFLSLSLSVVVSLIAILAKEWCHSFMSGRVGSMLKQGRIRQQRWDGIKQWKMREILDVLPFLLHIALLLFAVGLSVYLWGINIKVALPVVVMTALGGLFYVVTVILALVFRFCPYTTALVRFIHPYWIGALKQSGTKALIGLPIVLMAWMAYGLRQLKRLFQRQSSCFDDPSSMITNLESANNDNPGINSFSFRKNFEDSRIAVNHWVQQMHKNYLTERSQLAEQYTPMDGVTSSMICWMITNCEDLKSVDMALQALAGADPRLLSRWSLWECGAVQLVSERLRTGFYELELSRADGGRPSRNNLLDDTSLYSRSLNFLTAFIRGEGFAIRGISNSHFVFKGPHGPVHGLQVESLAQSIYYCVTYQSSSILAHSWTESLRRYEIAAFELGNIPAEVDTNSWNSMESDRKQCSRQWELVKLVVAGRVINLPSSALLSLVSGITNTYLYNPSQSPIPLVHLLNQLLKQGNYNLELQFAISSALAIAVFADRGHPGMELTSLGDHNAQLSRTKQIYTQLTKSRSAIFGAPTLLAFGLLSLLTQHQRWELDNTDVECIGECLNHLPIHSSGLTYHAVLPFLPASFGIGQHLAHVVSGCLGEASQNSESGSVSGSPVMSRLGAALSFSLCSEFGEHIILPLTETFGRTESVELRKLCLRGIDHSLAGWGEPKRVAFDQLAKTTFFGSLLEHTESASEKIVPYTMQFLLQFVGRLMYDVELDGGRLPAAFSLLQALHNRFTIDPTGHELTRNINNLGLTDLWLPNLSNICRNHPRDVLESGLLSGMSTFYEEEQNLDAKPRTTDLPSPFDGTHTWIQILQKFEEECQAALEGQSKESDQVDQKTGSQAPQPDVPERGTKESSQDLYWAM